MSGKVEFFDYSLWERLPQHVKDEINSIINSKPKEMVEVVHGKWIEEVDTMGGYEDYCPINYYCSKCEYLSKDGKTNYCPNCGARMDGGK